MKKQIVVSGLLGGAVMIVWLGLSFAVLRIGGKAIRPVPDQAEVHAALKKRITEAGNYACLYFASEAEASRFPKLPRRAAVRNHVQGPHPQYGPRVQTPGPCWAFCSHRW